MDAGPYTFDGECTVCGVAVFRMTRLGDEEITAMLEHLWTAHPDIDEEITAMLKHLWTAHPDILREPETMVLGDLLEYIRVKVA